MKQKPDLGFWKLWNLSFGFFGVQTAYALQSAQVSRIFSTIGADPHELSYFWILPPLMGLLVQPIVGTLSDHTWTRFGRRLPYLLIGALVAVIVMCFLPNAGSLGLSLSSAIIFGLIMLMLLDTSLNMAMQPFKMLVGDVVNEKQKGLAYSIQSALCNAGSVLGYLAPIGLGLFLSTQAPEGVIPQNLIWSFYLCAAVVVVCVIYTFVKVKEMPPQEYALYNDIPQQVTASPKRKGIFSFLGNVPKVFWTVGVVQFFCWSAFLYMWTYSTDAIAGHSFDAPATQKISSITINGKKYSDKYLLHNNTKVIDKGVLTIAGIEVDGRMFSPESVLAGSDTIIKKGQLVYKFGIAAAEPGAVFANAGQKLTIDGVEVEVSNRAATVTTLSTITSDGKLELAHISKHNPADDTYEYEQVTVLPSVDAKDITVKRETELNTASEQYQKAGNWNGVLLAIQGVVALLWAMVLPRFRNRKVAYSLSLFFGAIGFISSWFLNSQWLLVISFGLVGMAWAAMLAMPFTILTNALKGGNIGTYLGFFNCTICVPQIIAAICGGSILGLFPKAANGTSQTALMLVVAGILLLVATLCVWFVKETSGSKSEE